jgi:uncharacterized protein YeaO (DUF488 family)
MTVRIERIYDPPDGEGYRVLVDRLWPRGVTRQAAAIDLWAKALTPSDELRRWYHAHPEEGDDFAARYRAELDTADSADALDDLRGRDELVLVTAVRDPAHSHVPVLQEWLATRGVGA